VLLCRWVIIGLCLSERSQCPIDYGHRDPSHYTNISLIDGEMRRRVWCSVVQIDAISSLLVGLPSMIRSVDHDTAEPRNVDDWELTKDMTHLPPSRPLSHETPIAYLIAKSRILRIVGDILDFLSSLRPDSYEVVLDLEKELSQAHLQVPPHLRLSSPVNSADDHPALISKRIQLEYLYPSRDVRTAPKILRTGQAR
jgi:hypothetical protein